MGKEQLPAEDAVLQMEKERLEAAEIAMKKIRKERLAAEAALRKLETERKRHERVMRESARKEYTEFQQAPKGVPTIIDWIQNRDGTVSGFIKATSFFETDRIVKTSRVRKKAGSGSVIVTTSGSR